MGCAGGLCFRWACEGAAALDPPPAASFPTPPSRSPAPPLLSFSLLPFPIVPTILPTWGGGQCSPLKGDLPYAGLHPGFGQPPTVPSPQRDSAISTSAMCGQSPAQCGADLPPAPTTPDPSPLDLRLPLRGLGCPPPPRVDLPSIQDALSPDARGCGTQGSAGPVPPLGHLCSSPAFVPGPSS